MRGVWKAPPAEVPPGPPCDPQTPVFLCPHLPDVFPRPLQNHFLLVLQ